MIINIMSNPTMTKPIKRGEIKTVKGQLTYSEVQRNIWKPINRKELTFKQFAYYVGQKGSLWKSSLMSGAKNTDFEKAYVMSLDFDDDLTIEQFISNSKDLGLEPSFIYKTFSHTEEQHRFRVIWRLNTPIEDPQLKTAIQLMLMEVFPECDANCKDLSRLWVGGKEVVNYKYENTLNIENLINAVVTTISVKDENHATRNLKAFYKKLGINVYNKYPFILKSGENHQNTNNILYWEFDENHQLLDENTKNIIYDDFLFSFDNNSYNTTKATNRSAKIQIVKGEKIKKTEIDFVKLYHKCQLFNDFINGKKLEHKEIYHLSTNLYEFKKYPTVLSEILKKYNYNNWENKYNTYVTALNYGYAPSRCSNKCKYYNECSNPKNIKEKYYKKENKAKKVAEYKGLKLKTVEAELRKDYETLKEVPKNVFTFVKAPTGIGKSKLLETIDLSNTIVAVSNHRLGAQLYEDLLRNPLNYGLVYAKPLKMDRLPDELKYKIQKYYDLGLHGEVKNEVYEEIKRLNKEGLEGKKHPKYYEDLKEYLDNIAEIQEATSLLYTHQRMSFGTNNSQIDTIIIDEDFLKSFIKYDYFTFEEVFENINQIRRWSEKFSNERSKFYLNYLDIFEVFEAFQMDIQTHNNQWIKNPLKQLILEGGFRELLIKFIKENKDNMSMPIFKIINAEYVSLKNGYIHFVNGEDIKGLNKYRVIVLSATLDEKIHTKFIEKYLPDKEIKFKDYGEVELKANIYCDCSYSFSRFTLKNQSEKANKKLDEILSSDKYENIITFLDNDLVNLEGYNKKRITHYGAVEGLNGYEGQNLCVLGTPHFNSAIYEAYGVLLTGKSPVSNDWKVKRVTKNGFEFDMNTYESEEDKIFTDIQLYFLYSELVQAIGRARGIRFSCDIYVYSSMPIAGCTLI